MDDTGVFVVRCILEEGRSFGIKITAWEDL